MQNINAEIRATRNDSSLLSAWVIGGGWLVMLLFMITSLGQLTFFIVGAIVAPLLGQHAWQQYVVRYGFPFERLRQTFSLR